MPKGYHHLTKDQRCQLAILKSSGDSVNKIAGKIGVHRSSIYRELARNQAKSEYEHQEAHEKSCLRKNSRRNALKMTPELIEVIRGKLKLQWSPEQISGWMRKQEQSKAVSHETIYKYVWKDKKSGGLLFKELRHNGKKYNKRSGENAGRGCIPGRVDISERATVVEEKSRLGDWEIDTIIGGEHKGVIVSMVERFSKMVLLAFVPNKTAKEVEKALTGRLEEFKDCVLTITADNGKEFANHREVTELLGAPVYFSRPYCSWERGLNEHTNGLVRQYFPKKKRLDATKREELMAVEDLLNNRPRKILQFRTPREVFQEKRQELVRI